MMNFQGYNSVGRPTSKVINPPGGRSNNIFGSDEPAKPAAQRQQQQTQNSPDMPAAGQDNIHGKPKNAREGNNIFGNEQYSQSRPNQRSGYNTITGECYDAPVRNAAPAPAPVAEPAPQKPVADVPEHVKASNEARNNLHTSSRVLAPPGGHSTKLW